MNPETRTASGPAQLPLDPAGPDAQQVDGTRVPPPLQAIPITLTVNGIRRTLATHPMARLLDVLREDLGIKSVKEGCGEGECGACSVRMNGRLVNTCLVPAAQAEGAEILTVEGLAQEGGLTPLQAAFIAHNGTQCGFCTPGMLVAADDLVRRCPHPDEAAIRHGLAGNVCRCTGYVKIVDAVQAAAGAAPGPRPGGGK